MSRPERWQAGGQDVGGAYLSVMDLAVCKIRDQDSKFNLRRQITLDVGGKKKAWVMTPAIRLK